VLGAVVATVLLLVGTGFEVGAAGATTAPGAIAPARAGRDVDAARMMSWITRLVGFGVRRPGYPADNRAARWIEGQFRTAGLHHVRLEPVTVNRWTPASCRVVWWPTAQPTRRTTVPCFSLPFSKPEVDVTTTVTADDGTVALAGSIGLVDDTFTTIPQAVIAQQALDVVAPKEFVATDQQPIPFGVRNGDLFSDFFTPTSSRGGAAFLGILDGLGTRRYYAPYTGVDVDLPAAWIGERPGKALQTALASGSVTARLTSHAQRVPARSYNVVGDLPGARATAVVVGSHHDAPWASAVEDASGISEVLAQAHHWAAVPTAQRPHRMVFVATAGHMSGAAGSIAFIQRHPQLMKQTVLEVHLEHIARRATVAGRTLKVTDQPETRWWFTTNRPDLRRLVVDALHAQGMDRDLVLPAVGFFGGDAPLSDAAPFSLAGVPIVSLISTPVYLFDPRDTPKMIDRASLVDVRDATVHLIEATGPLTPPA
jgi:hypothetical protein